MDNPFMKPAGAFKGKTLIKVWRIFPDAWDTVDLDYDYIRPLTEEELNMKVVSQSTINEWKSELEEMMVSIRNGNILSNNQYDRMNDLIEWTKPFRKDQ